MALHTEEKTSRIGRIEVERPETPIAPVAPMSPEADGSGVADRTQDETPAATGAVAAGERRRPPAALLVVGVAALALIGLGLKQWSFSRSHVVTDNAQVEGHIIPVLPRVSGYVAEVRVEENQAVRSGETLVVLDDRDYRARLEQAEGDLAASLAQAGSDQASRAGRASRSASAGGAPTPDAGTGAGAAAGQAASQLAAARAAVAQAGANARRANSDLERYRSLAERNIISSQQLDAAEAAATAATAQLQAARDQVSAAAAGVRNADGKLAANRAARDQAALQLSYTRLTAPSDGVVSRKSVEVGQLVQPGQPLMSVVPLDDIWVVANLKETEIRDVNPGDRAVIEVDSYPGRKFPGHVESLSPATGAKFSLLPPDNATGNFTKVVQRIPVRIRLDGPQDPRHPLRPGMSVKATVTTR